MQSVAASLYLMGMGIIFLIVLLKWLSLRDKRMYGGQPMGALGSNNEPRWRCSCSKEWNTYPETKTIVEPAHEDAFWAVCPRCGDHSLFIDGILPFGMSLLLAKVSDDYLRGYKLGISTTDVTAPFITFSPEDLQLELGYKMGRNVTSKRIMLGEEPSPDTVKYIHETVANLLSKLSTDKEGTDHEQHF